MELYSMLTDKKRYIKCFYHKNPLNDISMMLLRITCSFVLIINLYIPACIVYNIKGNVGSGLFLYLLGTNPR